MESVSGGGNGNSINPTLENGDLFDEDTGDHLATVDLFSYEGGHALSKESPPAQLSLFFNGFWYVYKIDSRYEEEKEELPPAAPLTPRPE